MAESISVGIEELIEFVEFKNNGSVQKKNKGENVDVKSFLTSRNKHKKYWPIGIVTNLCQFFLQYLAK